VCSIQQALFNSISVGTITVTGIVVVTVVIAVMVVLFALPFFLSCIIWIWVWTWYGGETINNTNTKHPLLNLLALLLVLCFDEM
jgi:hypothetical protein